ncbi:MAG TPA: hypothetical protein DEA08_02610 [Planctomycetes bacterium]|nr:hypothetical protein [Planctomycetota bacterium]
MVLALEHLRGRASVAPVSSGEPATPREPTPSEPTPSEPTAAEPEPPPGEPPPADPSPAEPGPSPADPAPREDLDSIEAKLERLRKWREEGLIDEAEYQAKRQELLKRL